jgi:hypothetical protein
MSKSRQHLDGVQRIRGMLALCFLAAGLAACSRSSALLEQPALMPGQSTASLVLPPADVLTKADPNLREAPEADLCDAGLASMSASPDCSPALVANDKGIAMALQDGATGPEVNRVVWRGKVTANGIDVVNATGILCSGPWDGGQAASYFGKRVTLACSDGSVGYFSHGRGTRSATLQFNGRSESAVLQ